MKIEQQLKARELRSQGCSIKEIAKTLQVSPSSVSIWTRDIKLTESQIKMLGERNYQQKLNGAKRNKDNWLEQRKKWQAEGRRLAQENPNNLFVSGCMLYWAEGTKSRNLITLVNSDPNLLKVFIEFLKQIGVRRENIKIQINCFTDLQPVEAIEFHWLSQLGLNKDCLQKTIVNSYSKDSQKKRKNKLPFGVCGVRVSSVEHLQKIYGAIQELSGFDNPQWVA